MVDHLQITFLILCAASFFSKVQPTEFTIVNECRSTIWPAIQPFSGGISIPTTGFTLEANESKTLILAQSGNIRVWGRTDCSTDTSSGNFSCVTGDCGTGKLECAGRGSRAPATLAELAIRLVNDLDYYDVSLMDGFNLPMVVVPKSRGCSSTSCLTNLNAICPDQLRVPGSKNETVACNSACNAFGTSADCCIGTKCKETLYSFLFNKACPQAFSYAMDDETSTITCKSANYSIIFCPVNTSLISGPALVPPAPAPFPSKQTRNWIRIFLGTVAALLILLSLLGFFWCQHRKGYHHVMKKISGLRWRKHNGDEGSHSFSYRTLEIATNYFCDQSLLGRGGYGPVYKGKLINGQEIAVKRLQKISGHGIEQFKNEVNVILNLQHRNLVRLLGYCTQNDERILVYEYLPNKSLDSILFEKQAILLGWNSRLQIIEGIAQGLLYLHKYSRLKIIHRDLKTSNILLDKDLNPKISDFGTAKIFGDDESCANTNRIVGTYGYMAPEYAMDGIFSMKSDVFSFGVMMLEIISGKKNTGFYNSDRHINLLAYVWELWNEERFLEIKDPNLVEIISIGEVVRYVKVGLLCVQENAADRPNMSGVVSMLLKESMPLPSPKQPSFTAMLSVTNVELCKHLQPASINMVTISDINGR